MFKSITAPGTAKRRLLRMSDAPSSSPPQAASQTTFTVYAGPSLETVRQIVASQFQVKDAFLDQYGTPTILVTAEPAKAKFTIILQQLSTQGLLAVIRDSTDTLTIKIFQKPHLKPPKRSINLILFFATVGTVLLAGYVIWTGLFSGAQALFAQLADILAPGVSPYLEAGLFAAGLLAIIGLHEFGHKAAARHHKMDATLPYFIPGIPPLGTFGAMISLRSPPSNRDQLFDLGISGPVVGLAVTIVVAVVSMLFGAPATQPRIAQLNSWITACSAQLGASSCSSEFSFPSHPLILILLSKLTGYVNPNVVYDQQLFFAAQIGALLTFLNIIPAWQLDGGHISRAVFGPAGHRIASMLGITFLLFSGLLFSGNLLSGYWFFAIFVLVLMSISGRGLAGVEPLDDVSSVSISRKILYLLAIAMLVLTLAAPP